MNLRFPINVEGKRIGSRTELLKLGETDSAVQNFLGEAFFYGNGFPKDLKKAREYMRVASENGHSEAMTSLGYVLEKGMGGKADIEEAIKWYKKSYKMGNKFAFAPMMTVYFYGKGSVKQDMIEGFKIVKEGLEKNIDAETFLELIDDLIEMFSIIHQRKCDVKDVFEYSKQIVDRKYDKQCLDVITKLYAKAGEGWRNDYEQL